MNAMTKPEALMRQMIEVTPIRLGSRVRMAPGSGLEHEWTDEYVVVSMVWQYQDGTGHEIDIGIATDEDIIRRYGWTDGFEVDDFVVVRL